MKATATSSPPAALPRVETMIAVFSLERFPDESVHLTVIVYVRSRLRRAFASMFSVRLPVIVQSMVAS